MRLSRSAKSARSSATVSNSDASFAKELQKAGQISQVVAEVTRSKALATVLGRVNVVDKSGNKIDLEALRPAQPAEVQAADEVAQADEQ